MKDYNVFTFVVGLVVLAGFIADSYQQHMRYAAFTNAYNSYIQCRTEAGKKGFTHSVNQICGETPKVENWE